MLSLHHGAAMQEALQGQLDSCLNCLLAKRISQLSEYVEDDLGELVHFVIVEPGDHIADLDRELGFPFLINLSDGSRFGDPGFTPSFEWLQDHGPWFEVVYILSDDGFGVVVFIPDDPRVEFDIHSFCLEYSGRRQPARNSDLI